MVNNVFEQGTVRNRDVLANWECRSHGERRGVVQKNEAEEETLQFMDLHFVGVVKWTDGSLNN